MDWKTLYQTLGALFDTQACLTKLAAIWENDRWCSGDKNKQTAAYCGKVLEAAGLSQVELLPLKADGKTKYFDWTIPRAWDAEEAALSYADGEEITSFRKNPCSLTMYSPSTAPGGVTAQVIEPGRENPGAVQGKVLLVREPVSDWEAFAQANGAVGILSDYITLHPGVRDSREALYDDVIWMGMTSAKVFGFHLTPRQADAMRERLKAGPVWVHASVQSRRYDGLCCTVSAALEGTQPELPEVLLYGHLYEPGANDNAAGSAAILQLAQLFSKAVRDGVLPRPQRTIRFVLGYECGGSMGYLAAHRDRKHLCAMAVDMVGTEKGDNAVLGLYYNPFSNFSFSDGALFALGELEDVPRKQIPFSIATDNIMADPSLCCPAVAICAAPALSYHSSMDRPGRIEPETLTRNALIAGTYAWGLAVAQEDTCRFLAHGIRRKVDSLMADASHPRQRQFLEDVRRRAICSLGQLLDRQEEEPAFYTDPAPDYALDAEKKIPERLISGVLTYRGEQFQAAWNRELNLPVFWIDGKRNLWQIAYLSAMEKGRCSEAQVREELALLTDYFGCLEKQGYLRWKS